MRPIAGCAAFVLVLGRRLERAGIRRRTRQGRGPAHPHRGDPHRNPSAACGQVHETNQDKVERARRARRVSTRSPEQHPLWVDENGLTARGKAVIAEIEKADDYGLRARDYALPALDEFDAARQQCHRVARRRGDQNRLRRARLCSRRARAAGSSPERISRNLDPTLALPNPSEVIKLIAIRRSRCISRSFQPDHPQFEALRQKLLELRGRKSDTPRTRDRDSRTVPCSSSASSTSRWRFSASGSTSPRRTRMERLPTRRNSTKRCAEAVSRFQLAHGALPDGAVGPGTRRLLNGGPSPAAASPAKIKAILVNMERWRWLPRDLGAFYVTVNIPEFMLRVAADDGPVYDDARRRRQTRHADARSLQ